MINLFSKKNKAANEFGIYKYPCERGFNFKTFIIITSVILLISYGFFNSRQLLFGPSVEIFNPNNNLETSENMITVKGRVKNMSYLSLNEKPIYTNTEGVFEEKLLLSPGFNIIAVKARDRFKNETEEKIRVYYKESFPKYEIDIPTEETQE